MRPRLAKFTTPNLDCLGLWLCAPQCLSWHRRPTWESEKAPTCVDAKPHTETWAIVAGLANCGGSNEICASFQTFSNRTGIGYNNEATNNLGPASDNANQACSIRKRVTIQGFYFLPFMVWVSTPGFLLPIAQKWFRKWTAKPKNESHVGSRCYPSIEPHTAQSHLILWRSSAIEAGTHLACTQSPRGTICHGTKWTVSSHLIHLWSSCP